MSAEEKLGLTALKELRERVWAVKAVFDTLSVHLYERSKVQVRDALAKYTDEEILADPELLRFLASNDGGHQTVYQRKCRILKAPLEGTRMRCEGGMDARSDEFFGLPVLETWLVYKQDVQAEVNAAEEWAKLFLFDRPDLSIRVMERTLSSGGYSVTVLWTPSTNQATVRTNYYADHGEGRYTGTLEGALAYVAEHEWYEGGPERDTYGEDPGYDW